MPKRKTKTIIRDSNEIKRSRIYAYSLNLFTKIDHNKSSQKCQSKKKHTNKFSEQFSWDFNAFARH